MPPKRARADSDTFTKDDFPAAKPTAPPKKRARFADDDDELDPSAFEDNLERKTGRRGGVKVDGYESDSTDEGESVVRSRGKKQKAEEEDEDDMFAMGSDDDEKKAAAAGGMKKKGNKWMSLGDIEGQEFGAGEQVDDEEDSVSESDPEDEDDRIRKSKAGMGFEFTKFNMREEMEEGRIAEDGTYVKSFDQHAQHDKWLDEVGDEEMKKARRAKRKAERVERERIREEERRGLGGEADRTAMEMELLALMKPGETVLETLARLGKLKKKKDAAAGPVKKKRKTQESEAPEPTVEAAPPSEIEKVTAIASKLLPSIPEIYSTSFESILRSVRKSGSVQDDWTPPKPKFEYKWTVEGATSDGINGPYSEEEVRVWFDAGYFGDRGERVSIRPVGSDEWQTWKELFS